MAVRIPGAESVGQVGIVRDPGVTASPADFGAQIGEAASQFGSVVTALSLKLRNERQGAEDELIEQRDSLEAQTLAAQTFMNDRPEAARDPDGFHTRVTGDINKNFADLDKRYADEGLRPSKDAQRRMQARRNGVLTDYSLKAVTEGHNARVIKLTGDLEKNFSTVATGLAAHGDLGAVKRSLDTMYGTAGRLMSADQVDRLRTATNAQVGSSVVEYLNKFQDEGLLAVEEEDQKAYLDRAHDVIDEAVEGGFMDPATGAENKRIWAQNYAKRLAGSLEPTERLKVLGATPVEAAATGSSQDIAANILKEMEGFREKPYWDVNADRVGYGSDTITLADGTVQKVTKETRVTKADAERDLQRRINEFQSVASGQVGADKWAALAPHVQAALTSVAYNYGDLPPDVVSAVQANDVGRIADAIEGLARHNGGVNASRRAREAAIVRGGALPSGKASGVFASLPEDQRTQLVAQAQAELSRGQGEYKSEVSDYAAFLRAGNAPEPGRYTREELVSRLGPENGSLIDEELQEAAEYGADVSALRFASPEEVQAIVASRTAELSSPEDFEAKAKNLAGITSIMNERNKQIAADPAAYVIQDAKVNSAYKAMADLYNDENADEEARRSASATYAAATLGKQNLLGVPGDGQRILPLAFSQAIVRQFTSQPEGGQNAATLMRSLEAQWGKHWPQVFAELSEDMPATALVVGAMNRPDQVRAAEQLAEAAAVGKKAYEDALTNEAVGDIKDAILSEMTDFKSTLVHNPGGERTYMAFQEGAYLLALSYANQGEGSEQAAKRAYSDVLGKAYDIRGTFRVPAEFDGGKVEAGAEAALDTIATKDIDLPTSLIGLDEAETKAAYVSNLRSKGFWITAPDESGLVLYDENRAAVTVGGQPVTMTWDELQKESQGRESNQGRTIGEVRRETMQQQQPLPGDLQQRVIDETRKLLSMPGADPAALKQRLIDIGIDPVEAGLMDEDGNVIP